MDPKIECLYLIFYQPETLKGQKAKVKYIIDFFSCDGAFDFCSRFVRPGNYLYGEYMKHRTNELKSKINTI